MALVFENVTFPPLADFSATAPGGALIALAGERGCGKSELLRLAAGLEAPLSGRVAAPASRRLLRAGDALDFQPAELLLLDHAFALEDGFARARAAVALEALRRAGCAILLATEEEDLALRLADEVWWLEGGKLAAKGDPGEVLGRYRRRLARRFREWGAQGAAPMHPSLRRGDGRARLLAIETLDGEGRPTMVWQSGEPAAVRVTVRFDSPVADPVVGIMIRTRIGFEVFGTNTELERVALGPCRPGDTLRVTFAFGCGLCPREYTVTAASHDPDGVWHDWAEDAVAVSVADSRYTAGVANLRAAVTVERGGS